MSRRYVKSVDVPDLMKEELLSGRYFSVTFVKRGDNSIRAMTCQRRSEKKGIGGSKRKSRATGLLTVYDVVKRGYRTVNLSGVHRLRMNGIEYRVKS